MSAAQRRYDNLTPEPYTPEPGGALPCVCGFAFPWFNLINPGNDEEPPEITIKCRCGREGPSARDLHAAEDKWNAKVEQWTTEAEGARPAPRRQRPAQRRREPERRPRPPEPEDCS